MTAAVVITLALALACALVAWLWPVIADRPRPLDADDHAQLARDVARASERIVAIEARFADVLAHRADLVARRGEPCPLRFTPPPWPASERASHDPWVAVLTTSEGGERDTSSALAGAMRLELEDIDPDGDFTSVNARHALSTASELAARAQPDVLLVADRLDGDDPYTLGGTVYLFDDSVVCGLRIVVIRGEGRLAGVDDAEGGSSSRPPSPERRRLAWARYQAIGPVDRESLVVYSRPTADEATPAR